MSAQAGWQDYLFERSESPLSSKGFMNSRMIVTTLSLLQITFAFAFAFAFAPRGFADGTETVVRARPACGANLTGSTSDYEVIETGRAPLKAWIHGVTMEDDAKLQLQSMARLPFIFKHIAVMPDVHVGKGATVGSVIATKNAVIPAAVGVDIGCGMLAVETKMTRDDLPKDLSKLRAAIEAAVPVGGVGAVGGHRGPVPSSVSTQFRTSNLEQRLANILAKHPQIPRAYP